MGKAKPTEELKVKVRTPFMLRAPERAGSERKSQVHVYRGRLCDTEKKGSATPRGLSPLELVLNSPGGVIPLWDKDVVLKWRFQERAMEAFENPVAAAAEIRKLFGEALLAWGDAAPVRFSETEHLWDFEIAPTISDSCNSNGCVLASAFFPDAGRHELVIYPKMFEQSREEQVETLVHEVGHVFGLRHFFAQVSEEAWPSEVFGKHDRFSIMNYGDESVLTENDKSDLKKLYELARSGDLKKINGTPIKFVRPFSSLGV
jgi:hypothetical protein